MMNKQEKAVKNIIKKCRKYENGGVANKDKSISDAEVADLTISKLYEEWEITNILKIEDRIKKENALELVERKITQVRNCIYYGLGIAFVIGLIGNKITESFGFNLWMFISAIIILALLVCFIHYEFATRKLKAKSDKLEGTTKE